MDRRGRVHCRGVGGCLWHRPRAQAIGSQHGVQRCDAAGGDTHDAAAHTGAAGNPARSHAGAGHAGDNGETEYAGPDIIRDTYAALLSVGHTESQARQAIHRVMNGKKKFKTVADMIEAIYQQSRE